MYRKIRDKFKKTLFSAALLPGGKSCMRNAKEPGTVWDDGRRIGKTGGKARKIRRESRFLRFFGFD
ncbi:hypothetical protein HMPREF3293_01546 [Christensenella minuta]|uniref:Uncharacterized protein n=1 Tax=Christensenella minuta TaxID=626937 RepID=A0A136Q4P0_9FIRM|nr:hypothetical protein HMPREF3293_01546 [Christensenella minuta]